MGSYVLTQHDITKLQIECLAGGECLGTVPLFWRKALFSHKTTWYSCQQSSQMSKEVRALSFSNLLVYEEAKYKNRFIVYITALNKSVLLTHKHTHTQHCATWLCCSYDPGEPERAPGLKLYGECPSVLFGCFYN